MRLLSIHGDEHPRKAPVGVYDEGILCDECERGFGALDDYGNRVLLAEEFRRESMNEPDGTRIGYMIHGFDYARLKSFFLSVLWRASISRHDFYNYINLGPHQEKLEHLVMTGQPGSPDEFAVMLFELVFKLGPIMFKPYPSRMGGFNFMNLHMGRYQALIKIDKRPYDAGFCTLRPNCPLAVTLLNFEGGKHEALMWDTIRNNAWRRTARQGDV